jgi:hypothetical protein
VVDDEHAIEQSLPGAENDRKYQTPELIDQFVLGKAAHDTPAS